MKNKLRVGVLVNSNQINDWSYKMLSIIKDSSHSEIVLVVKNLSSGNNSKSTKFSKLRNKINKNLIFNTYFKFEEKVITVNNDAFSLRNLKEIANCDIIEVRPKKTKFSDYISEEDINNIQKYNLDVIIRLGFRILRGGILSAARYGVWSYHHGDNSSNRGGPAGIWEVIEGRNETGVVLQQLSENLDGGFIISKAKYSTKKFSFLKNRNDFYWKALHLLPRELEKLFKLGEREYFKRASQNMGPDFYYDKLYITPDNWTMGKFLLRNSLQLCYHKLYNTFYNNQWGLIYSFSKTDQISKSFFRFKKLMPPKDRFWADPFPFYHNNRYYIFFEELLYKNYKGRISYIELNERGEFSEPSVILEKDYHLSYPFLFKEDEDIYLIPESAQNKTVDLYKCVEFPDKWEYQKTLIDNIHAVDTTVLKRDGKYWLFCNVQCSDPGSSLEELFIFYSDDLFSSNWIPHSLNPVKKDVSTSRPAGHFMEQNGVLLRPSQNSAKHYGHSLVMNEVIKLNENEYEEKTVQNILPNWDDKILSIHTINHSGRLTVGDIQTKRRK